MLSAPRSVSVWSAVAFFVVCLAGPAVLHAADAPDAAGRQARQILDTAGVQGGLIVHVGCGDGKLTAALRASERYVVQGLDADPARVAAAREFLQAQNAYGPVSVDLWTSGRLPYAENLVNLLVADGQPVAEAEVQRVLAPLGVALVRDGGGWKKTQKAWPADIGQWTHFLQDAGGNAVAHDRVVAPPKRLQWEADPQWCRSHEFPSSASAAVTAGGRLFSIFDEGPTGIYENLPQRSMLVARDAANGLLLWKRSMRDWDAEHGAGHGDRWHIHQTLPRRLVAVGDRVYVTLAVQQSPVSVLDAATGAVITEALEGTAGTDEMVLADGLLVVKITDDSPDAANPLLTGDLHGSLAAVDLQRGKLLWKAEAAVAPYALALAGGRVVYHNLAEIVCLDARSGHTLWRSPHDAQRVFGGGSTLVVSDGVVLYHSFRRDPEGNQGKKAGKKAKPQPGRMPMEARLVALDAADGRQLWTAPGSVGLAGASTEPTDLFVAGGLVWCGASTEGRDLRTGEVKKTLELGELISHGHHYRCYRSKATDRFLIYPKRGAEFVDLEGQDSMRHDWLRAPCFTGMLPANGLLYALPSQCFCYPGVKLSGFLALAPGGKADPQISDAQRLERGPAFVEEGQRHKGTKAQSAAGGSSPSTADDWPMYRHDPLRSGASLAEVPLALARAWEVPLACQAAQPVVVGQQVFVAEKDAQRIRCLNAADGRQQWAFTAGARIDSAPTVHAGRVLFGCRDGAVYCLRADDGQLAWRFTAAPAARRIVSHGQVESAWPVSGSVLVQDGVAYFAAGRSSFLDGGLWVYGLDANTGAVLHQAHLEGPWPNVATDPGTPFAMEGARADLLVSDGRDLYMQRIKFDPALHRLETPELTTLGDLDQGGRHLLATGGFLDDSGFDRLFWMYTTRWPGFYYTVQAPKSGQLIVFDPHAAYSLKYFYRRQSLSPAFIPATEGYLLFADDVDNEPILVGKEGQPAAMEWLPEAARTTGRYDLTNVAVDKEKGVGFSRARPARWQTMVPVRATGLLLAANALVLAGPPDVVDPQDPLAALEGRKGAVLQIRSPTDGRMVQEMPLAAPPVFDGLSAAGGRLFLSTTDGKLTCFAAQPRSGDRK